MAEGKKSFVMYCEWRELFDKLTDDQSGKLIKHIFAYVNDDNPEPPDVLTDIAFTQIKQQFKRDLVKYESICDRNKLNGSKGGRPKTQKTQSVILETQANPNNPIKDKGERISDKGELIKDNGFSKKKNGFLDISKAGEILHDHCLMWIEHRKQIKKPIASQMQFDNWLKLLRKYSEGNTKNAKEIIEISVANGWQGVFDLPTSRKKSQPGSGKVAMNDYLDNLLSGGQTEQKQIN